jgi:hypothetical protein
VRPSGNAWVLESEIQETRSKNGVVYQSVTHRAAEKMTLSVSYDRERRLITAETIQETAKGKKTARVTFDKGMARLIRDGKEETFKVAADAVVTTAPDWSDILLLVRRYDRTRGGRQEFSGFWFHPVQPARLLSFSVERLGEDTVQVKDRRESLGRYRITLRSGAYLVWADNSGKVWKLSPAGNPKAAVVLEGYEKTTALLK